MVYDQATDRYLPISWDEALAKIGAALRAVNRFAKFWTPIPRLRPNDTQSTW
jgi:anaerobic selenocysteine-containing dehydrogenase